jgi:23S rRNA (uracil1939-C5)-methyltransferase
LLTGYAEDVQIVEIEKLVYGGDGLARLDGRVIFVPFVIPGEQASLVELTVPGRKSKQVRVDQLVKPARERVESACPIFTRCGGCHYQQIPYPLQLTYKVQILRETLARLGGIDWSEEIETVSGEPWGYRNRTKLHIRDGLKERHGVSPKARKIGFFEANSHRLVESTNCPINSPGLNRAHKALAEMVAEYQPPKFITEVEFFSNEVDLLMGIPGGRRASTTKFLKLCADRIPGLSMQSSIDYSVGQHSYQVAAESFFQVNRFLIDHLVDLVTADAEGINALDLYAGVGIFSVPIAERVAHVKAVDSSTRAVRFLQKNAHGAGVEVQTIHLNVEDYVCGTTQKFDFVVADPPRTGLGPVVTKALVRMRPGRLKLVSCDPATLARDLQVLVAGGFKIEKITLVDLFPQTYHIEAVVQLA